MVDSVEKEKKDLKKALRTYLNTAGPGDYEMTSQFGSHSRIGQARNGPSHTLKTKTKLAYFPDYAKEFAGQASPKCSLYNPNRSFVAVSEPQYSVTKDQRFTTPSSVAILRKNLPVQYSKDDTACLNKDTAKMTSQGYGKRYELKTEKKDETTPGPIYDDKSKTISSTLSCLIDKRYSTFGGKEQQVYFKEQQKALYGKATPGPGKYKITPITD